LGVKIIVAIAFGILVLPLLLSSFFDIRIFFEIPSLVVVIACGIIYFYELADVITTKRKR
jgi:hypothetical protein